ncbi:hypothetical protein CHGG_10073 [Chaetomium globosum CBS 148.51]|uniref:Chitin-binding type-1 domain-containing protein n=1 Tax=Chaetomium globosum (strain ATCC 6205 / CBS 148.51 / DSM 1962 / NBRC 6347 / NRRL 1970) TaxID=306901 RepID=Q2GPN1_CHAGB|nr:uncharacterized protein CHGG_10073 [Chaetomium globosum CBS 148.51]EAQ83669.1 hypothetical protein CHGG_10073 [Chaetomium globosum CBS 148.51]
MFLLQVLPIALSLLFTQPPGVLADDCPPITWTKDRVAKRSPAGATDMAFAPIASAMIPIVARNETRVTRPVIQPGEINCRFWHNTYEDPTYYTCTEMANLYGIALKDFFFLNPTVLPDCSNLKPNTKYCVIGFIEPLRSTDGFCGPQHNNATCLGTEAQCCNAETWTCGNTEEDCANGTCYEGACFGDVEYSTDGTCGWQHGSRKCAGKWGDCCHHNGTCGTGTAFCAKGNCQSGNCDWDAIFQLTTTSVAASSSTITTDPSAWPTFPITDCVGGKGPETIGDSLCDRTCRLGFCPAPCTCTNPSTPEPLPDTPPGVHCWGMLGVPAEYDALCSFICAYYSIYMYILPARVCTIIPYTTTPTEGAVCVRGEGEGDYMGLCEFSCRHGFCPSDTCSCTLYGHKDTWAGTRPGQTGTPGVPAPGRDESYAELCSYACDHGYCPEGFCVIP